MPNCAIKTELVAVRQAIADAEARLVRQTNMLQVRSVRLRPEDDPLAAWVLSHIHASIALFQVHLAILESHRDDLDGPRATPSSGAQQVDVSECSPTFFAASNSG
ncbi:hypothetical protein [Falsiroseomonas sp. E2-1-a20]|uniref:hypothetical protein n=1 Tax=Falsiroseomonas sp. E2-1-a20 TaxID=3239300 RepID=UPI003F37586C